MPIDDESHKTTLRIPLGLFKRIHQLWQQGQEAGRLPWTLSRAAYMVRLMEIGAEMEEVQAAKRRK